MHKQSTKRCYRCGVHKPLSEFSKDRQKRDGLHPGCKACENARVKIWREENPDKAHASSKRWIEANREHWLAQQLEYREARRDELAARSREYYREHREKVLPKVRVRTKEFLKSNPRLAHVMSVAHQRVGYALKTGRLVRPTSCEECRKECKPEAAHSDYSQPLLVRWLCRS